MKAVIKLMMNELSHLAFMTNLGMVAIVVIVTKEWNNGVKLENDKIVSVLAISYYLFFGINIGVHFTYVGVQTFLVVIERLSNVFKMEEHKSLRITHTESPSDVCV